MGKNKSEMEAASIINPKTNKLVVSKSEIKEVIADYCKDTLSNNEPEEDYIEILETKKNK